MLSRLTLGGVARTLPGGAYAPRLSPNFWGVADLFFRYSPPQSPNRPKTDPQCNDQRIFLAVAGDILFAVAARRREAPGCSKKKGACSRDSHTTPRGGATAPPRRAQPLLLLLVYCIDPIPPTGEGGRKMNLRFSYSVFFVHRGPPSKANSVAPTPLS